MGDALFHLGRYEEALESLALAVSLQPDLPVAGPLLRLMGRAAQELGRSEEAAHHYARALEIGPRDAEALDRLAMLRFGQQRYAEAHELYRTLAEIIPDSAQTHANLGATLYHMGRTEEAIRSYERAVSVDPTLETARSTLNQIREILRQGSEA